MKSSEFRGFSPVFKFTLAQTFKQKSYIVILIIMVLCSIGVFPVMKLMGNSKEKKIDSIGRIYCINNTNISELPIDKIKDENDAYGDIEFIQTKESVEEICGKLDELAEDGESEAILVEASMDMELGGYIFRLYYSDSASVKEDDVLTVSEDLKEWFTEYKITSMNIDEGLLKDITTPVNTEIFEYDDFVAKDKTTIISMSEYNMVYVIMLVFYLIIVLTSSLVANKVVEEKANRIVEYLMTTVRPMALMLGKIVAMVVAGVGEVVIILVSGFASYQISERLWPSEDESIISSFISSDAIGGLGIGNVILCIAIMVIGVFLFSLISGLFGASVSKMEELQQGLQIVTVITLIAFFASLISINLMWSVGINGYVKVTMFVPFTSVMIMPGVILIGEASLLEIIISIVIMLITLVALFRFVSLIYESVIVMNGSRVGLGTMIKMAKDSLKKDKGGAVNEKE